MKLQAGTDLCRKRHRQSGLATVEFAIVLPVLMLMIFTCAELGRALYTYNTLTKAVRGGVRYAAENILNPAQVVDLDKSLIAETKNMVVNGAINPGQALLPGFGVEHVSVEAVNISAFSPPQVRVSADYEFVPMVGNIPLLGTDSILNGSFKMLASSTMRAL